MKQITTIWTFDPSPRARGKLTTLDCSSNRIESLEGFRADHLEVLHCGLNCLKRLEFFRTPPPICYFYGNPLQSLGGLPPIQFRQGMIQGMMLGIVLGVDMNCNSYFNHRDLMNTQEMFCLDFLAKKVNESSLPKVVDQGNVFVSLLRSNIISVGTLRRFQGELIAEGDEETSFLFDEALASCAEIDPKYFIEEVACYFGRRKDPPGELSLTWFRSYCRRILSRIRGITTPGSSTNLLFLEACRGVKDEWVPPLFLERHGKAQEEYPETIVEELMQIVERHIALRWPHSGSS